MNFKSIIKTAVILPIILFICGTVSAQNWGVLSFEGQTMEEGKPLKGALVTVYQDPYGRDDFWPVDQFMTAGNAKFKIDLDYNSSYIIEVGAEGGYVKTFFVNTDIAPGLLTENKGFEVIIDFTALKFLEDLNTTAKINFDDGSDTFALDNADDVTLQQASGN